MWENIVQPDRTLMTIGRVLIACWITKATNTHWEYAILIDFPLQQWLQEFFFWKIYCKESITTISTIYKIFPLTNLNTYLQGDSLARGPQESTTCPCPNQINPFLRPSHFLHAQLVSFLVGLRTYQHPGGVSIPHGIYKRILLFGLWRNYMLHGPLRKEPRATIRVPLWV